MKNLKKLTIRTGVGLLLVISGLALGNYGLVSIGVPLIETAPAILVQNDSIDVQDE